MFVCRLFFLFFGSSGPSAVLTMLRWYRVSESAGCLTIISMNKQVTTCYYLHTFNSSTLRQHYGETMVTTPSNFSMRCKVNKPELQLDLLENWKVQLPNFRLPCMHYLPIGKPISSACPLFGDLTPPSCAYHCSCRYPSLKLLST